MPLPDFSQLQHHLPQLTNHRAQLVFTALGASLVTAFVVSTLSQRQRQTRRRELEGDVLRSIQGSQVPTPLEPRSRTPAPAHPHPQRTVDADYEYDEELIKEQLARNYAFFGDAVMLARSGVSHVRLIDFDYVTLSSLNRHATALLSDVGTPKVTCVARTLRDFARWIDVDPRVEIWRKEEGGGKLLEGADWVIDAIDNIQTKSDLLHYCHSHNIRVFSSMGAGAKTDPTRIQIADISNTVYDPLARAVRRRLRLAGIASGIPVVYSTEVPGDIKLLPLPEDEFAKGKVEELGVMDNWRVRVLPVLGPLPAIFGLHAATYVLSELAGKPIPNPLPVKNRKKIYERMLREFQVRENRRAGMEPGLQERMPMDEDDVSFLLEDVHRGRSVVPPHPVPIRPTLVRWNPAEGVRLENVVVMESSEAAWHETGIFEERKTPVELWGEEVDELQRNRRDEVRRALEWVETLQ
ncbi:tRNA threonylcarbamoyladenosine dehydratase [Mycena kentingensis (nom. inval.)]|nr:tRNA threonylcarbamoyladenosine dehydratase [Mycena kentingensis (nom. inval.)]